MIIMESIWEFLSSPNNQDTISWIAGGIAAIAAGLWAVLKLLYSPKPAKPPNGNLNVTADRGGIAGGRDVNIGLRGLSLFLILLAVLSFAILLASRIGDRIIGHAVGEDQALERVELSLFCGVNDDLTAPWVYFDEATQLSDFVDLIEELDGRPVYVQAKIERYCNACECQREVTRLDGDVDNWIQPPWEKMSEREPEFLMNEKDDGGIELVVNPNYSPNPDDVYGWAIFEAYRMEERKEWWGLDAPEIWTEGYQIMAVLPEFWAYSYSIYLPRRRHLRAEQYRSGEYGTVLAFDGIFVARSYDGTGGGVRHLEPLNLDNELEAKLTCIREGRAPTLANKLFWGC
ncbi:hypothetical protein Q5Y75_11590 [Ruegeria sp. 2205SS24-7]|uniref:hypothetical protein n=1 Tax=Ruegeria discodermiae TaxID=3064389 RepID=UPI00274198E6|nr:hypothetical protein [Ruegeria sp. 2205SS24-7]MDP5217862.1 hypothetical protein [Ruegeria sp. 2205SS24-7]